MPNTQKTRMVFPLIKVGILAAKQLSKPLAKYIQNTAKNHPYLANKILIPSAQGYHSFETNIKLRLLGMGKAHDVKPLSPEMALQLGSDMLGEFVIFSVATLLILFEYGRQTINAQKKEVQQNDTIKMLEVKTREADLRLEEQSVEIKEVKRLVHHLQSEIHPDMRGERPKEKK